VVQLECDFCVFAQLKRLAPDPEHSTDKLLLACIRRANLDALWSPSEQTVVRHARHIQKGIELAECTGIDPPFVLVAPLPAYEHCGYEIAVPILLKSHKKEGTIPHISGGRQSGSSGQHTEIR
jgi:hypothetical protein